MKLAARAKRASRRTLLLRGALALSFVAVLAFGFFYHRARAQVSESLFGIGDQMMRYVGADDQDAPRDLLLNGERIRFSSGTSARSLDEVLDHFEARCAEVDGDLARHVTEMTVEGDSRSESRREGDSDVPTLREQNTSRGWVACLDLGEQSIGPIELAARIRRFGSSGDVHEIGEMRYVFAEHDARLGTHFVAMWTEGSFDVAHMFPEEGDAPGREVPDLARAPGTRRVLSGWERDQPHTMNVYESRDPVVELETFYRRALAREHWELLEGPRESSASRTLIAERGERMVTIVLATDLESGGTRAAVFDTQ